MEKRLFLAIALSLGVVFLFQKTFGPSPASSPSNLTERSSQTIAAEGFKSTTSVAPPSPSFKANTLFESKTNVAQPSVALEHEPVATETFSLNGYEAEFSAQGGDLVGLKLVEEAYRFPVTHIVQLSGFQDKVFALSQDFSDQVRLVYEDELLKVVKTYAAIKEYQIQVSVDIINKSDQAKTLGAQYISLVEADISRMDNTENRSDWTLMEYAYKEEKIRRRGNASKFNEKWTKKEDKDLDWVAYRDRYFVTLVDPENVFSNISIQALGEKNLSLGSEVSSISLAPKEEVSLKFNVYAGPQRVDVLKDAGYNKVMAFSDWGWLDAIAKFIHMTIGFIHKIVPLWGACIILMALLIYGVTFPLTFKSLKSMKKMQMLQPKMAELKKKYAKNPEQMNKEVVELYRQHGVNPLGGCLPLLFQMPIFIGIYQVIWRSFYFRGESFLWIADLSKPDHLFKLPFSVPLLGEYFNILPILVTMIMVVQQKMNTKNIATSDPDQQMQQKMMATIFPIFLGVIFYKFSAGLNLYFVVFYILSTFTQWKISQEIK